MDNKNYRKFCIWCNETYKTPHNYKLHLLTNKHKENAKKIFNNYDDIITQADNDIMKYINQFENINYCKHLNYETALLFAYNNDIELNFNTNVYNIVNLENKII